jgi:uncharacterized coiled-coil protein SlyX
MDDNIIQLQEALLHQAEDIARMQTEMYTQQKEISHLKREVEGLRQKFKEVQDADFGMRSAEEESPPPHY